MYFDSIHRPDLEIKELQVEDCLIKNKRRPKIGAYGRVVFEYKRMRLFLSVYSNVLIPRWSRYTSCIPYFQALKTIGKASDQKK